MACMTTIDTGFNECLTCMVTIWFLGYVVKLRRPIRLTRAQLDSFQDEYKPSTAS
jgi:hypothetical protein